MVYRAPSFPEGYPEREATSAEAEKLRAAGWKLTGLGTLWIVPNDAMEYQAGQRFFSVDEALEVEQIAEEEREQARAEDEHQLAQLLDDGAPLIERAEREASR
jgi:hypothetical protein